MIGKLKHHLLNLIIPYPSHFPQGLTGPFWLAQVICDTIETSIHLKNFVFKNFSVESTYGEKEKGCQRVCER